MSNTWLWDLTFSSFPCLPFSGHGKRWSMYPFAHHSFNFQLTKQVNSNHLIWLNTLTTHTHNNVQVHRLYTAAHKKSHCVHREHLDLVLIMPTKSFHYNVPKNPKHCEVNCVCSTNNLPTDHLVTCIIPLPNLVCGNLVSKKWKPQHYP